MNFKRRYLVFIAFIIFIVFLILRFKPYQNRQELGLPGLAPQGSAAQKVLTLAILSDSHSDWDNLTKAIELVNQNQFDLAVFLGDLTKLGEPADLQQGQRLLETLKIPYYVLSGNHDLWFDRQSKLPAGRHWQTIFSDTASPACLDYQDFNLVFLDNADEYQKIAEENWSQTVNCLNKTLPTLVFSHIPLYHPANERIMGQYEEALATQVSQLRQLLCEKKVKLALAGHLHSFAKYTYPCNNGYLLPMLISGALTQERNFQPPRFLEVTVFEDGTFEEKEIVLP